LAALVQDSEGIVVPILQKLGTNVNYLKIKLALLPTEWVKRAGFSC
jgi:hypothetical protein